MAEIYIEAYQEDGQYFVSIKSLIVLTLYEMAEAPDSKLIVKISPIKSTNLIQIDLSNVKFELCEKLPKLSKLCIWPIVILSNHVVAGLCSVGRQICKISEKDQVHKLLGFREACLVASAESSIWTKFCELDITETINNLLNGACIDHNTLELPKEILILENHLRQPVKIHNIYKLARTNQNDPSLKSSTPVEVLKVPHDYAEGPYVSLADLILYPCFRVIFKYLENYSIEIIQKIPLVLEWFQRLLTNNLPQLTFNINIAEKGLNINLPTVNNVSLYKSDRVEGVKHTKQHKIEEALNSLKNISLTNEITPVGYQQNFNWDNIPIIANPLGGNLPAKRADRKCQQLENLAKAALQVVGSKIYTIVDFCSGSGHLGILVAIILPKCHIILVENKERSLARAKETINSLKINNITIVQSNLDYFIGNFQLGIALHACGVATDLVLKMCVKKQADFICCPCCYGGVKDCHELTYPRSSKFKNLFLNNEIQYFNLAHAADQTHTIENKKTQQGYLCMDVIDMDRKCYTEDCGYEVHLGKLSPSTCTNKNNLLVGIYKRCGA